MTDTESPAPPADRLSPWIPALYRLAGLATVILAGWCLWLAFAATPRPMDIEAKPDQQPNPMKSHSAPPKLAPDQQEGRLIAEITDVSDSIDAEDDESKVVTAVQHELTGTKSYPVKAIGHSAKRQEGPSSAAWLTGTIDEDVEAAPAVAPEMLAQIPAWKRTSKSLKRLLKTTSTAAERR
jgi:hypothetical protein